MTIELANQDNKPVCDRSFDNGYTARIKNGCSDMLYLW